jgi:PQQ-dependent catabolism-associated CXXCW motif protein
VAIWPSALRHPEFLGAGYESVIWLYIAKRSYGLAVAARGQNAGMTILWKRCATAFSSGLAVTVISTMTLPAQESEKFDEQSGYRISHYRAPIFRSALGTEPLLVREVAALADEDAILLDVAPVRHPRFTEAGNWILAAPHESLPGAVWLPVAGWGDPEDWMLDYLETALTALTRTSDSRDIVVFCKIDCWLSWNAARRIKALGYENVHWFAGGVDDWQAAGLSLVPIEPWPVQDPHPDR